MVKQHVETVLFKVLQDVAETALNPNGRDYVYVDVDYVDERVDFLVNRLVGLGYKIEVSKYPEDRYSSLTITF